MQKLSKVAKELGVTKMTLWNWKKIKNVKSIQV